MVVRENYCKSFYYVNKTGTFLFPFSFMVIDLKMCGWYEENYEK